MPAPVTLLLEQIRETILCAAPGVEATISSHIPCNKLNGPLVCFAAFKNHCAPYIVSHCVLSQLKEALKTYKLAKTTIQFTIDNPLPTELLTKIVKTKVKENASALLSKATGKTQGFASAQIILK